MSEDFDREEGAFRDGFRNGLEGESFRPLDPLQIIASAPRSHRPWGRVLAAAAVVLVAGVGVGVVVPRLFSSQSATPAAGSAAAAPEGASGAGPMDVGSAAGAPRANATKQADNALRDWVSTAASPLSPRSNTVGAWLGGEFYLIGGQSDAPCPPNASCRAPDQLLRDGAAYSPATDTWRRIADAPIALSESDPVVVGGRLYLQRDYGAAGSIYAYDPAADVWSQLPSPSGGGVLVALGDRLASVAWSTEEAGAHDELWDPVTGRWARLPASPLEKAYERVLVQVDGRVLLFAKDVRTQSSDRAPVFRLAELDLATGKWRRLPDSEVVGVGGRTVGGRVVFPEIGSYDGGEVDNWGRSYPAGGIYDPATGSWAKLPGPARYDGGLQAGRSAVAGGLMLFDGRLLDPVDRRWIPVSEPPLGNLLGQTVVTAPDGILVFGGWDGGAATDRSAYVPLR